MDWERGRPTGTVGDRRGGGQPAVEAWVLCGGTGTRLWPLSRRKSPKQLIAIGDSRPLIVETLTRLRQTDLFGHLGIVTGAPLVAALSQALASEHCPVDAMLVEPQPRNTAAAIAAVAMESAAGGGDPVIAVFPSDHAIDGADAFRSALADAVRAAMAGRIAVIGVAPDRPEPNFGYIGRGDAVPGMARVHTVRQFVEKPAADLAARLVADPGYLWNSGIFVARCSTVLEEMSRLAPDVVDGTEAAWRRSRHRTDAIYLDECFAETPSISFDYAVMEGTDRAAVVCGEFEWSDLGTWQSVWQAMPRDASGNSVSGKLSLRNTRDSLVWNQTDQLVVAIGLEQSALVATRDAILTAPLDRMAEIGGLVSELAAADAAAAIEPPVLHKPWGRSELLADAQGYRIKRLVVVAGGKLSLQRHRLRSERWVVVEGRGRVSAGKTEREVGPTDSVFVAAGATHRIENIGDADLVVVEVQFGDVLDEDDIERLADDYGRDQRDPV